MAPTSGPKGRSNTADSPTQPDSDPGPGRSTAESYTVVARRYRPQRFEDVVGQDHVVRALRNAIRLNRIAQAYLFCGTRGVGKTTMARIFAKCLNCVKGPTEEPCQVCDICRSIAQGQDVDVIEIDGASNNGVEQVRELRQNAGLRPSRARYKIYYIDEVHMLSTGAFNALLKTLEEPPSHVKFFFATTEANKIPITVLSRCQRFDLAGITPEEIGNTLAEICKQEGVSAEPEALQIVARRASGSLRDAQSLLDRLLASGSSGLTVEIVHSLLGTASDERLLGMLEALADHDAAGALQLLEDAANEGVQPAELLSGVLDFLRDALMLSLGAKTILLSVSPRQRPRLDAVVARWPVDSMLAGLQILAEHRTRLRGSLNGRLLVEMSLVRVARLEDMASLESLIERLTALESGAPPIRRQETQAVKKKHVTTEVDGGSPHTSPTPDLVGSLTPGLRGHAEDPIRAVPTTEAQVTAKDRARHNQIGQASHPQSSSDHHPLELQTVQKIWPQVLAKLPATLVWRLTQVEPTAVEQPDILVIAPKAGYNTVEVALGSEILENLGRAFERVIHRRLTLRFERSVGGADEPSAESQTESRRMDSLNADPLVQKVVELFEARSVQLDYDGPDTGSSG